MKIRYVAWVEHGDDLCHIQCRVPVGVLLAHVRELHSSLQLKLIKSDEELIEEFCVVNFATIQEL